MTWMKVETVARSNPKIGATVAATGHCDAAWLWLAGNLYCRDSLTDGFIADFVLPTLVPALPAKVLKPLPGALVAAGLWHRGDGGYHIHDFLDHNPTKAAIESKRKADNERKKAGSKTDSSRIPNGVHTTSVSHAGERADAHLSLSSDSPGSVGSSEGGPGETVPPRSSLIVSPAAWGKVHGTHAAGFCDWMCLPADIFGQMATRLGGEAAAIAWARSVRAEFIETGTVPTGRPWEFWEGQLAARFGSSQAKAGSDPLAGVKEALRRG